MTVELIPFSKGAHFGMLGDFTLLGFDNGPEGVVFLERSRGGDLTVIDSEQVAEYLEAFERLRELALPVEQSATFIQEAAEQMRS